MKMICEVPDEVIKCIKDGTWCGSSVAEKMITNGIPLSSMEEPCEDVISRQAAIDMQYRIDDSATLSSRDVVNVDDIEDLPSVTPQPKTGWIPVSERLPEIHQDVLLSFRSLDVGVGFRFRGNTEPYYYCHGVYIVPQNVLAWQPLPEPYKAEGSDKE